MFLLGSKVASTGWCLKQLMSDWDYSCWISKEFVWWSVAFLVPPVPPTFSPCIQTSLWAWTIQVHEDWVSDWCWKVVGWKKGVRKVQLLNRSKNLQILHWLFLLFPGWAEWNWTPDGRCNCDRLLQEQNPLCQPRRYVWLCQGCPSGLDALSWGGSSESPSSCSLSECPEGWQSRV